METVRIIRFIFSVQKPAQMERVRCALFHNTIKKDCLEKGSLFI